jgi:hypothetical protein
MLYQAGDTPLKMAESKLMEATVKDLMALGADADYVCPFEPARRYKKKKTVDKDQARSHVEGLPRAPKAERTPIIPMREYFP